MIVDDEEALRSEEAEAGALQVWSHCHPFLERPVQLQLAGVVQGGEAAILYGSERQRAGEPLLLEQVEMILAEGKVLHVVDCRASMLAEDEQARELLRKFTAQGLDVHPDLIGLAPKERAWVALTLAEKRTERPTDEIALGMQGSAEVAALKGLEASGAAQETIGDAASLLWRSQDTVILDTWRADRLTCEELIPLKRRAELAGGEVQALGLTRQGQTVSLYTLWTGNTEGGYSGLEWGGRRWPVEVISSCSLASHDREAAGVLRAFCQDDPWRYISICAKDWTQRQLVRYKLAGQWASLSELPGERAIHLQRPEGFVEKPLQQTITLATTGEYPKYFTLGDTGSTLCIEGWYLRDPWAHLEQKSGTINRGIVQWKQRELAGFCQRGRLFPTLVCRMPADIPIHFELVECPDWTEACSHNKGDGSHTYLLPTIRIPWDSWQEGEQQMIMLPIPLTPETEEVTFILAGYDIKVPEDTITLQ